MEITDFSIRKVPKDDPRYPKESGGGQQFTDVYLLSFDEAGADLPIESVFYVTPVTGGMTHELAVTMLRLFAQALDAYRETEKAA